MPKLNIGFAFFPYTGTSSGSSQCYDVSEWYWNLKLHAFQKYRQKIGIWTDEKFCDTPVDMTRNQAMAWAKASEVDILFMVDSDMSPDVQVGKDPAAKPFFDSTFDYMQEHWRRGPLVIGAPYCAAPPVEAPMILEWSTNRNGDENRYPHIKMMTREQVIPMRGFVPCAAIGTGLIAIDMRITEFLPAKGGYFYYEHDDDHTEKLSTEDVVFTRNVNLAWAKVCKEKGIDGYPIVLANMDAWAGHVKTEKVGKPMQFTSEDFVDLRNRAAQRLPSSVAFMDIQQAYKLIKDQPGAVL